MNEKLKCFFYMCFRISSWPRQLWTRITTPTRSCRLLTRRLRTGRTVTGTTWWADLLTNTTTTPPDPSPLLTFTTTITTSTTITTTTPPAQRAASKFAPAVAEKSSKGNKYLRILLRHSASAVKMIKSFSENPLCIEINQIFISHF